jgi:hypothetical protein
LKEGGNQKQDYVMKIKRHQDKNYVLTTRDDEKQSFMSKIKDPPEENYAQDIDCEEQEYCVCNT